MPEAVIFDMDGLLLDTERLTLACLTEACRAHGVTLDPERYYPCIGTSTARTREILAAAHGPDFPLDDICEAWWRRYHAHVLHRPVPLRPGAREALEAVAAAGLPCALATTTEWALASRKLALAELDHFFDAIVAGDQVTHTKPHPEPYLEAARRLGVDPARCVAVEDSDNGVRAAHAAGMAVLQIPDMRPPADDVRALGHRILPSLHDAVPLLTRRR